MSAGKQAQQREDDRQGRSQRRQEGAVREQRVGQETDTDQDIGRGVGFAERTDATDEHKTRGDESGGAGVGTA